MLLTSLDRFRDHGLLLLRLGVGASFIALGLDIIAGGQPVWTFLGQQLAAFGITAAPAAFGLGAGIAEAVGGLLLILGLLVRPALIALAGTMVVALTFHLRTGDDWTRTSHAFEALVLFVSLFLIGPGRFSLDAWLASRRGGPSSSAPLAGHPA